MITEQVMALGDWSVTLRPDTPASVRERISIPYSHLVVTAAWVDIENAGLDDAGILAAARYTGVALRPGPQLNLGGQGLAWWFADADNQPWARAMGSHNAVTWASAYSLPIFERFTAGSIAAGGSFTTPVQFYTSRRDRVDQIATAAGHEWRVNPNLTFDAGTVADLYGTAPAVILVDAAPARGPGLVGLEASFTVEEDWEQWGSAVQIFTQAGATLDNVVMAGSPSATPTGQALYRELGIDVPDVPRGFEQIVANDLIEVLNVPRQEVAVRVPDRSLVDHVNCGDLVYVYDELQGLRDFANQVQHGGRTIWPKIMRATRLSWPVRSGMGVYWRTWEAGAAAPYWADLTPYVQWEDGDAQLDLVQGDAARYSLNPSTGRVDQVGAAIDRAMAQPWATYTPTWTAATTNPVIGNGTITGRYRRIGTTGHIRIVIRPGSTTTFGSGSYSVDLPPGWTSSATEEEAVVAKLWAPGSDWAGLGVLATGGDGTLSALFPTSSSDVRLTLWTPTSPATFANGGNCIIQGTIELNS